MVTGPIYAGNETETIGPDQVSVPSYFYKVIFDPVRIEAIAFILPNQKLNSDDLPTFIVSVNQVEAETGLDFFPEIEDSVEDLVEARVQEGLWQ